MSIADCLKTLGTDTAMGLSDAEAAKRLKQYGPNAATDVPRAGLAVQFARRFRNPLIIMLIFASVLAAATGDRSSFIIILVMVFLSVLLDFFQEVRAENAVDGLRKSVANNAQVLRGGRQQTIPLRAVVPGDIVLLSPGMLIPADGRLIDGKDLYVNQALLTGESFPVEKDAKAAPAKSPESSACAAFMGTSVISGAAAMVACATGKNTKLGALAGTLVRQHPPTRFERGIQDFGLLILRMTVGMVLFVLLINLGLHRPLLESFLFALALAVGLTPELLPMLTTITLSRGAVRMAKSRVIVKHLPAMHNLGAMDILCTDKTGTLTEADIRLAGSLDPQGKDSERPFLLAYVNSSFESGIKSPLDEAILAHGKPDISAWKKLDEVPFDFERRRVSVLAEAGGKRYLIVKGAPEDIIRLSTHYETGQDAPAFDAGMRKACPRVFEEMGNNGLRALGVAVREVEATRATAHIQDEAELTFAGFVTFADPAKPSAGDAIRKLCDAGIGVNVITGDNERVTRHLCRELNFDPGEIITGEMMDGMSDEALAARTAHSHAFCRVNPNQKSRIIAALKKRGHTVGFLGDGINDAAALHEADCGISVTSATDVAKAAADVILLDQDLGVIRDGVLEGRRAVENTEKYILMGSSSNFGNVFSMAGAALLLPFLPMLPTQILLNNLLYDLSQTALPFDNVDDDAIAKPVQWDIVKIRKFMWVLGPVSSLFDFVTFYVLLKLFGASEALFHTGWFVESLVTQVLIVLAIRTHRPAFRSRPKGALVLTAFGIAAFGVLLPFTPLGAWLGFVPLPGVFFGFLVAAFCAYTLLVEIIKALFRREFT